MKTKLFLGLLACALLFSYVCINYVQDNPIIIEKVAVGIDDNFPQLKQVIPPVLKEKIPYKEVKING